LRIAARHPVHGDAERSRGELVQRLAALAAAFDKPGLTQRCEMLRDRLPRDRQLGGELGRRRGLAFGERLEHVAAVGIGERVEDAPRRVVHAYE